MLSDVKILSMHHESFPSDCHTHETLIDELDSKVIYCYCYCCQIYRVYYGTVAIHLSDKGMDQLVDLLQQYLRSYEGIAPSAERTIEVNTPLPGFMLFLSINDLHYFSSTLRNAQSELHKRIRLRSYN